MKFKIPNSTRTIWVNTSKYLIQWDKPAKSKLQTEVKNFLRPYLERHIVCEELRLPRTRLFVDIVDFTSRLAYEVQGQQHNKYVPFFQQNITGLWRQWKRDSQKATYLEFNGYKLIEIFPEDINNLSKRFFKEKFGVIL